MINKNSNINLDIVVISCDQYCDVWQLFFKNLFNNWANCPFNVYLITNNKKFIHNRVININVGNDISWSDNLKKGLGSVKNKYVLLMIDDLIINKKISNSYFRKILHWMNMKNPNYVRLHNSNSPKYYDDLLGIIYSSDPYKTSTMPSIWKKSTLIKLLKNGESAWDFEIIGSKRAKKFNGFFSVYKSIVFYDNAIIKGKWQKSVALKYKIKNSDRFIMTTMEQNIYNLRVLRSKLFNLLPSSLRKIFKE